MTAPITQDVLTLPRKLPESDKTNIVGLTRDALRDALIAAGTPEKQAKMRVGQVWQWVYHWGVRDFALMTNLAKDYRALLADNFTIEIPEVVTRQISKTAPANTSSASPAGMRSRWSISPKPTGARCASPVRSAAR